ncbi:transposase [Nonomuraea mesophila]|uniref:Transposase n=1 Tax=Nonomuraea mesophila TaxID=2530382 RepID=A0A4R5F1Z6_9ACTN|nr:transposase [Nonomuraea mesophila]
MGADSLTALASFTRNLRRDLDTVRNGLTLPHSSGPVEGHVNYSPITPSPSGTPDITPSPEAENQGSPRPGG